MPSGLLLDITVLQHCIDQKELLKSLTLYRNSMTLFFSEKLDPQNQGLVVALSCRQLIIMGTVFACKTRCTPKAGGVHYCMHHKPAVRHVSSSDSPKSDTSLPTCPNSMANCSRLPQKWPSRRLFRRHVCKVGDQFSNLISSWYRVGSWMLLCWNLIIPIMLLSGRIWFWFWWLLFNLFHLAVT